MPLIRSLLSRLFGSEPQAEAPVEAGEARSAPPVQEAPPPDDTALLALAPEHALYRLHSLRTRQAGVLPAPELRLSAPEEVLPAGELSRELGRLKLTVTTASAKRLDKASPRARKDGEEPPPPDLDAQAIVFLTKNQLTAWVLVFPPVNGGKEIDQAMLEEALRAAKVTSGVDQELLARLPEERARYFRLYLAAVGSPAVHGKDGSVVDLFSRQVERKYQVNERGQVDYATLNTVQNADEGEIICRIILPTPGQDGQTVLGQTIPGKDGRPAQVPRGRNTAVTEDGSALIATRAGHVEFNGRSFEIKPLLEIGGNVDFSTGNINFLGDVHIHGDVCSGFTVRAIGSVTVDGVVEACTVEAGGDLIVVKGVQGNDQAVIRSQRNIFVKYLENCSVYARGNIQADCIIQCNVFSDGEVLVRSGRGTIIGGNIRAAQEVSASIVGSKSEQLTQVVLGGCPCEEFERRVLELELQELLAEEEKVAIQPESPAKLRKLSTLRMKININKTKLKQFQKEMEEPEEQPRGRLVFSTAYPGTEITIGGVSRRLTTESQSSSAVLMEGEITLI